jgi:hypothetical protein
MKQYKTFIQRIAIVCFIMMMGLSVTFCGSDDDDNVTPTIDYGNAPKGVEAINLGLPSGTKWASCNVGATKPEEYGGYYAWGETEEKEDYREATYKYYHLSLGSDISGTEYDVAHVKWRGNWRMPTKVECEELLAYCIIKWTTLNGVNGSMFISKINGNSIFLPAAGHRWQESLSNARLGGLYWSSTQYPSIVCAYSFCCGKGGAFRDNDNSSYGRSVRAVWKE